MSDKITCLDDFLLLLKGVKQEKSGKFMALCPGHDDIKRSLSIKQADSKILVKCFAGCKTADILKLLNLTLRDLFLNEQGPKTKHEIVDVYHYVDATGKPFEVVRTRPKGFYQRRPDGKGGYINNLKGIVPTLYHQDKLKEAIYKVIPIYIVEGEKDVERLEALGLIATTNPMGAGKWNDSYSETLRGADLIIIPDNDMPGRHHVNKVANSCYGRAKRIRVLEIPDGSKDVSDWLDSGGDFQQLVQLIDKAQDYEPPPKLPVIIITEKWLREITTEALNALYKANLPEFIFWRGNTLTRIRQDEKGRPMLEALDRPALRGYLSRSADFIEIRDGKEPKIVKVDPPLDVVDDILKLETWEFPPIIGIVEAPVLRLDGTIVTKPGYDKYTKLYYSPLPELSVPSIPDKPSDKEIRESIKLVLEPLFDFPFDSQASLANAVATLLTVILRPMIDGPVPLAIFDKPQAGTGASLLAEVIGIISTGRTAPMMPAQKDEESWRKAITSLLLRGQAVVTLDNVVGDLYAPSLEAVLTANTWQDRILGRSEMVTLPNRVTWIATGNNVRLRGSLPRRCFWVRMDAKMARPWMRAPKSFRHSPLLEWVRENRGTILAAIMTIARAWVIAGIPKAQGLPNLGGYEGYCQLLGGVLAFMGVDGFLANLEAMYDEKDTETPQWAAFLETWHEIVGEGTLTAAELIGYIKDNTELRTALPDAIADTEAKNYTVKLGQRLGTKNNVRYPNGFVLMKAGEKKRAVMWKVVRFENGTSPNFRYKSEVGEVPTTPARGEQIEDEDNNMYVQGAETTSPTSPTDTKKGEVDNYIIPPPYPEAPCYSCGCGDFWLTDWNEWLCPRCHPEPGS